MSAAPAAMLKGQLMIVQNMQNPIAPSLDPAGCRAAPSPMLAPLALAVPLALGLALDAAGRSARTIPIASSRAPVTSRSRRPMSRCIGRSG